MTSGPIHLITVALAILAACDADRALDVPGSQDPPGQSPPADPTPPPPPVLPPGPPPTPTEAGAPLASCDVQLLRAWASEADWYGHGASEVLAFAPDDGKLVRAAGTHFGGTVTYDIAAGTTTAQNRGETRLLARDPAWRLELRGRCGCGASDVPITGLSVADLSESGAPRELALPNTSRAWLAATLASDGRTALALGCGADAEGLPELAGDLVLDVWSTESGSALAHVDTGLACPGYYWAVPVELAATGRHAIAKVGQRGLVIIDLTTATVTAKADFGASDRSTLGLSIRAGAPEILVTTAGEEGEALIVDRRLPDLAVLGTPIVARLQSINELLYTTHYWGSPTAWAATADLLALVAPDGEAELRSSATQRVVARLPIPPDLGGGRGPFPPAYIDGNSVVAIAISHTGRHVAVAYESGLALWACR